MKEKWLSEDALQIVEKRRVAKGKRQKIKGNIYPTKCRAPEKKKSKEKQKCLKVSSYVNNAKK